MRQILLVIVFLFCLLTAPVFSQWEEEQYRHAVSFLCVAYSPDSKFIAGGTENKVVAIWPVDGKSYQMSREHRGKITALAFSPDGKILASGSADKSIILWQAGPVLKKMRFLKGHTSDVIHVFFYQKEDVLASVSQDQTVRFWEIKTGKVLRTFSLGQEQITSASFSPDGRFLTVGTWDGSTKLFIAKTGVLRRVYQGHQGAVVALAFWPKENEVFASAGSYFHDRFIRLWNINSKIIRKSFSRGELTFKKLVFSPVEDILAAVTNNEKIVLWNIETGKALRVYSGHVKEINDIAFSPDGLFFATASSDYTIRIWDADKNQCVRYLSLTKSVKAKRQ